MTASTVVSALPEPPAKAADSTSHSNANASNRERFYRERFPDFWRDIEGSEYAAYEVQAMERPEIARLRSAATAAWHIFTRVAPVLRALPDEALRSIGIPPSALSACRLSDSFLGETVIGRFDFALTTTGPKILELNAETPFFLWESYEIAGATALALGFDDPNEGAIDALGAAIGRVAGGSRSSRVAVTAYNTWREDWFSAVFAARIASAAIGRNVDVVPLHELRVFGGALRDGEGTAIDVLWRLYPLEHLATDRAGPQLFNLLETGALRLINPPSALLLQNKAALAIIWELAERGIWFDATERATIARYFLPTYLDVPAGDDTYVRKPVFGREGNSVSIVRGGATLASSTRHDYRSQPAVYQKFVELPKMHGESAIATCFIVDGTANAIALRVGGPITDARARFVPIGISRTKPDMAGPWHR